MALPCVTRHTRPDCPTSRSSPRRQAHSRSNSCSWLALGLLALGGVANAAQYEPPGNQVLFGSWLDTASGYSDTPSLFNARIGKNVPVYQIAQNIPLLKYNYVTGEGGAAPEALIELSETDAAVFLTVYPGNGFAAITPADITQLGNQILDYQVVLNRTVFLRFAPEMQGQWNSYGQQPSKFLATFIAVHDGIKAIAPATIMVWAPNTPQGYPYGQNFVASPTGAYAATTQLDIALLDTNRNGILDAADDAFAPYYPGDAYVDWIGLSLYYKGPGGQDLNVVQPGGYCAQAINGVSPDDGSAITNWYQTYCAGKLDKACMFSESGAAYHVNVPGGATNAALHQAWVNDCITNTTFLDLFPRIKLIMQFEYEKFETSNVGGQDLRDYRLTNDTAILAEVVADFSALGTRFSWANSRAKPTSISTPGAPAATSLPVVTESNGQVVTITHSIPANAITATTRARPSGFPDLFGSTSDGSQRAEIIEVLILVASGVAGSLAVMRFL